MVIYAPVKKIQELITLIVEELSGDDNEFIETLRPTLDAYDPELNEAGVDELIRIIKERRKEREKIDNINN